MAETSRDKFCVFIGLIPFVVFDIYNDYKDAKGSFPAVNLCEDNNFKVDFFKTKQPNKRL